MLIFAEEFTSIRRNLEKALKLLEATSPALAYIETALVEIEACQTVEEELTLRGINKMSLALLEERIDRLTRQRDEVKQRNSHGISTHHNLDKHPERLKANSGG